MTLADYLRSLTTPQLLRVGEEWSIASIKQNPNGVLFYLRELEARIEGATRG